jgi:hypothetical protein
LAVIAAVVGSLLALALASAPPAAATTPTTMVFGSWINPSTQGQAIYLGVIVSGDSPTGQVVFGEPGSTLGVVDLDANGVANLVVPSLSVGEHTITATYAGDANNDFSTGTLVQTVVAPPAPPAPPVVTVKPPKVKLVASTTKSSVGGKVTLRWHSKNADSVTASGDWSGGRKAKGSLAVRMHERGKHVYKLTVQNAAGAKTSTVKVLVSRKAKEFELVVTDELTMVGSQVAVTADGLAAAEEFTIRLNDKSLLTGKADKKGNVSRTIVVPKTTPEGILPLTITGSNPNRVGTAALNVIAPKGLDVEVVLLEIPRKQSQTVIVTGLAAGETVTLTYAGAQLTVGMADATGTFTYDFAVGTAIGQKIVKAVGADPSRTGTASFNVVKNTGAGGTGDPPTEP